jgi:hypothetical protein
MYSRIRLKDRFQQIYKTAWSHCYEETAIDGETNGKVHPCVEVVEACGEWFVRVVEEDQELTRSFELESYALAFAEASGSACISTRLFGSNDASASISGPLAPEMTN